MIYIDIQEYLLSLDNFQKPKVVTDKDAIFVLLVRLLLLEPGTFQSHPNMGVGIISRYRYSDSEDLGVLQDDITNQISTYLPDLQGVNVLLSLTDGTPQELQIQIKVDDTLYVFTTDTKNNTIKLTNL